MTDEENKSQYTFEAEEQAPEKKKSNKTLWIVLGVIAVVIVLCLLVVVLVIAFLWPATRMDQMFSDLPLLLRMI